MQRLFNKTMALVWGVLIGVPFLMGLGMGRGCGRRRTAPPPPPPLHLCLVPDHPDILSAATKSIIGGGRGCALDEAFGPPPSCWARIKARLCSKAPKVPVPSRGPRFVAASWNPPQVERFLNPHQAMDTPRPPPSTQPALPSSTQPALPPPTPSVLSTVSEFGRLDTVRPQRSRRHRGNKLAQKTTISGPPCQ